MSKTRSIYKLANLGIIVASLGDISEENARGVRSRKCCEGWQAMLFRQYRISHNALTRKSLSEVLYV